MAVLLNELELAAVALAGPAADPALVYAGRSAATKSLPCVICAAEGGSEEEDPKGTGNFWVNLVISVKGTAATEADGTDPTPADVALVDAVFGAFLVSDLPGALNAQGRLLTVFPNGCITSSPRRTQDEAGVWADELPIRVYCCASVLAT